MRGRILPMAWAGAGVDQPVRASSRKDPIVIPSRSKLLLAGCLGLAAVACAPLAAQVCTSAPIDWMDRGEVLLAEEDPVEALAAFRAGLSLVEAGELRRGQTGLGRCHLLLGQPEPALEQAQAVTAVDPAHDRAWALEVRALMRARRFREGLRRSREGVETVGQSGVHVLASHASALFRTQNNVRAEARYRDVLLLDSLFAEAHLRLGSGLTSPCEVVVGERFDRGVELARAGRYDEAVVEFRALLDRDPANPIAHRLLGESLYNRIAVASMATNSKEFRWLSDSLPEPDLEGLPVDVFMPSRAALDPARRRVVDRALALFSSRLARIVAMGGRHDLIVETERTTDDSSRATLRGRRTFDGRVWDDVRGIGGLRAATGIESLDEARFFGFDTLAHEIAHQAHLYGFPHKLRVRITALYKVAIRAGRCLDFYAASNDTEYFGQGVEAFASLGKRPGYEVTHGHTRFELMRVDPDLHELIRGLVDYDPLDPEQVGESARTETLRAAVAVALRCGRYDDAVTAARMLRIGPMRTGLEQLALDAQKRARSEGI